jgi:hypothetical protein
MMSFRLWCWMCWSAMLIFVLAFAAPFLPSRWTDHLVWMVYLILPVGILGALFGILLAFGKLKMTCPQCGRSGSVGATQGMMWVNCKSCGSIGARIRPFGPRFERIDEDS